MSELEPTRTCSNPTATERIRAMLDERGVEWKAFDDFEQTTQWSTHNGAFVYWARERDGKLLVETTAPTKCSASCTPEQAIAATLGAEDIYTRADVESAFVSGYSLGLDMYDSSKPDSEKGWNQNERNLNEEMEDLGWVRKEAATLGSCNCSNNCTNGERTETCKVDVLNTGDCAGYECSEYIMHCNGCGHEFGHVLYSEDGDVWMSEPPNFCPNCGRRIEQ